MAMDRLKLEVILNAVDRMSRPLKAGREESRRLTGSIKETRAKIRELIETNAALQARMARGEVPTRAMMRAMRDTDRQVRNLNNSLRDQESRLENLNRQQQRMAAIRASSEKIGQTRDKLAGAGVGMMAAGGGMLMAAHVPLDEAKKFQGERTRIAALGLGASATKEAEEYARAMNVVGTSTTDNMTLVRDATTIFADTHHAKMVAPMLAKMKFANEAVFGKEGGAQNEEQFMNMMKVVELRGGTKSEGAFKAEANRIQQVITATGGRVGADQWRDLIKTGGVAAKQMRSDAFYNQLEPLVQEMGGHAVGTGLMSAYQGLYQGKTTVRAAREMERLGLLDKKKVEYDKVGQLKRFQPGALLQGELFTASPFEWLQKVLLPKLAAKGITDPGKINDAIASIFSNRTAANLMATMVMQRDQINKSAKLSMGADGIDELHKKAQETADGKELIAQAKLRDIMLQIGEKVLPVYMQALDAVNQVITATSAWIQQHPTLAKWVAVSAVVIGGLLVVLGGLLLGMAALLAPFAMVGSAMAGFGAIAAGFAGAWAVVTGVISASTAFLMANPIIAIIGGIAIAALLIYKYWEPIKTFFINTWNYINDLFSKHLALNFLFPVIGVIRLLVKVGKYLIDNWQEIKAALIDAWTRIDRVFAQYPILNYIFPVIGAARWLIANWESVKTFFMGLWAQVTGAFSNGLGGITKLLVDWSMLGWIYTAWQKILDKMGLELPKSCMDFGVMLMKGFANGITSGLSAVDTAINNAGDAAINWFKAKLGIHSPSRVFATLGHYTMQGLDVGLQAGQRGPLSTVNQLTRRLMVASAAGVGVLSAAPISAAPPVTPIQMSQSAQPGGNAAPPITVHIHAAPGMDEKALAQLVAREIERAQREKAARNRARLID